MAKKDAIDLSDYENLSEDFQLCNKLKLSLLRMQQGSRPREELAISNPTVFRLWHLSIRYLVPPAVGVILITGLSS